MTIRTMKKTNTLALALCASSLGLAGCSLDIPDLNNPSIESLRDNPTRSSVTSASSGLLIGNRAGVGAQNGYVALLGVLGREAYVLDTADPRYISEMLAGPGLDPGSPAFGGNFWTNPYANIRNANTLLEATDKVTGVTEAEKESIRGFTKTIEALDFLVVINTRDTNGAPIDVNRPLDAPLAPIESKEAVFAHIATLLDEGKAHLQKAGTEFPFPLSTGFKGFDTPATFLKFNRAVKARVDVYRKDWGQALTDLSESFIDPAGDYNLGVYYVFSGNSGDTANALQSQNIYAHPSVITDAEKQDGSDQLDARVLAKVTKAKEEGKWQGVSSDYVFTMYPNKDSPIPLIRNEELLLLRAEAHIGAGDVPSAADELNTIRVKSGKLAPRTDLNADNILDELLKQRRYSLLFEGGHRWIDMRRYGKLNELPIDVEGHSVHPAFPIPVAETDARK